MPEDQGIVPMQSGAISLGPPDELSEVFNRMNQFLQAALGCLQLQDSKGAMSVVTAAKAQFAYAQTKWAGSSAELISLKLLLHMICLYQPLTRSLQVQQEGRYSEAIKEIDNALRVNDEAIKTLAEYENDPAHDPQSVSIAKPILGIFPVMLNGLKAYNKADMIVYLEMTRGKASRYVALLEEAITVFNRAVDLPPSDEPNFLMLLGFCWQTAERLRARADSLRFTDYVEPPTGKKILIIYGRDEARWRELRDLLEKKFEQKTVVLEDEVDAGDSVIQKFVKYASQGCYAFVLLIGDDVVTKDNEMLYQARPNVLFELGWFYGRFGPDRVSIIRQTGTSIPSDLAGIVYMEYTKQVKEVANSIENELRRIGAYPASGTHG